MLRELDVKNIALIQKASVEFGEGFNVLTGETGAGKSMIIDAALLALGGRPKKDVIREGADEAFVGMTFDVTDPDRLSKLEALDISFEDEKSVIISRKISPQRTTGRINDEPASANKLKKAAELLIDIYGQHDSSALMDEKKQLGLLDQYLEKELEPELANTKRASYEYERAKSYLSTFDMDESSREREMEMLSFKLSEISNANIKEGEEDELELSFRRLTNAKNLIEALSLAKMALGKYKLEDAARALEDALKLDEKLDPIYRELLDAQAIIEDALHGINDYAYRLEVDEPRLSELEDRLDLIRSIKLKYGKTLEDIEDFAQKARDRLDFLKNYEESKKGALDKLNEAENVFLSSCQALSIKRQEGAKKLSRLLTEELSDLGFEKAVLSIRFERKTPASDGYDRVSFYGALNPKEPTKPISEAASGGELSRIMLGLKTVLASSDDIPTLIFDEIDTGISGRTAQKVAEKLSRISKNHQVICVTHLPQIAAMADNHFLISKESSGGRNITRIIRLDNEGSVLELARLLGGTDITKKVMDNAAEMKELAEKRKAELC